MNISVLLQQLNRDLITALKDKDALKADVLRLLKSAIHNEEIANKGVDLKDEQIAKVLKNQVKTRKEAMEQYQKAGQADRFEKEKKELEILSAYMPEQMSKEEIEKIVLEKIKETGASGKQDFGKIMGAAIAAVGSQADGKIVNQIVSKHLL